MSLPPIEPMEEPIKILLIEDDEDDYIIVREVLTGIQPNLYEIEWVRTYGEALEYIERREHDLYLLDYRLGDYTGLELLEEARRRGYRIPFIFLTGQGGYETDIEAMKRGAYDYLEKETLNPLVLERSIRYALDRWNAEERLQRSEQELRFLSSRLLTAQEDERKRIAMELHDSICQSIAAMKIIIENTWDLVEADSPAHRSLAKLSEMSVYTLNEIRGIISDLRPSVLDNLGIAAAVSWVCRQFHTTYREIELEEEVNISEREVPESIKLTIYRVLQECLNNIAKHSQANRASVSLNKNGSGIELSVRDNGKGIVSRQSGKKDSNSGGIGLVSMRERVEFSGGIFSISSSKETGTIIKAVWPRKELP